MNALIIAGSIAYALAGVITLAWAITCLARSIRAWLWLRRVTADLLDRERAARRFWAELETRGLAAVPSHFPLDGEDRWLLREAACDDAPYDYEDAGELG